MFTMPASDGKPRIYFKASLWWCVRRGTWATGLGATPVDAYRDWIGKKNFVEHAHRTDPHECYSPLDWSITRATICGAL